jgi:hypothetical protein
MHKSENDPTSPLMPEAEVIQANRARQLVELSLQIESNELRFSLQVGALHLARSIPDYWYTIAKLVAQQSTLPDKEANGLRDRLSNLIEQIFLRASRYELIDTLRRWDFHWEPLLDPATFDSNHTYRRSAPMKLTTGPVPGSMAGIVGTEEFFLGSGRRVGRRNYYEIQQSRFLDESASEVLPLGLAILQFLDELPICRNEALAIPEIKAYFEHPMQARNPK